MPDNYLLIPLQLDVMVLNKEAETATPFNRSPTQYTNLKTFADPDPPFPPDPASKPSSGIYLHWTLPKAIRQATYHKDTGKTGFTLAPNRWLVVRVWAGASAVDAIHAWFLESDCLSNPSSTGEANFVDPNALTSVGTPTPMTIGKAVPFDSSLLSLPSQPNPFLLAVGPGSMTFANFSPNVQNVFAFTDPVQDNNKAQISKGNFTYYVVGWYSDAKIDPLSKTEWNLNKDMHGTYANNTFDWYVFADSNNLPKTMLVHGMVSSVSWDREADNPPPQNFPIDIQTNVKVAIGNTAVDALAAMVRLYQSADKSNAATEADLLEAFQYGLLDKFDQPGSSELLNMTIREHWYGASSGGTLWRIVPQERKDSAASPATDATVLMLEEATLLATLNSQQAELDRQQRILESMQWNLHALWWKYNRLQFSDLPIDDPENVISPWFSTQLCSHIGNGANCNNPVSCNNSTGTDPSKESWYYCQVQAQQNAVAAATTTRDATKNQLQTLVGEIALLLKATNAPQFHFPNDPVVLITGLGRATNFDPQGSLLCRLPSQTLNSLTVGATTYTLDQLGGTNIENDIPVLNDPNHLLPDAVQQLHRESFFLSPQLFAEDVGGSINATDVQNAIGQLSADPAKGHLPPVAFTSSNGKRTWEWQQPWVPLLLDWKVAVLQGPAYSSHSNEPTCTFNQSNWCFNCTDYIWTGSTDSTDFSETTQMELSGRTFITPYLVFSLADQLRDFVQKHHLRNPQLEALLKDVDQYVEGIKNEDIVSQRLGGLMAQMVQRSLVQTVVPSGDITKLLRNDIHGVPKPFPNEISLEKGPPWDYGPVGGTFFVIQKLRVVDTFGRTINLLLANNSTSPQTESSEQEFYFFPIPAPNLQSPTELLPPQNRSNAPSERMVQLTPRIVQDSRLAFHLTSNDGKNCDINHLAEANPICGWIVPNHLDRSLSIYGPDGTAFGELYLSKHVQDQYVPVWQSDPTNSEAPQSIADISNTYLRAMLQTLYDRTDNAFSAFIRVIDETLWTINPRGQRKDQNLSILIGRPLALVRAQLSLKLRGLPFYNQDWWNMFKVDLGNGGRNLPKDSEPAELSMVDGVLKYLWPVRLGSQALRDDGLIGYYTDDPSNPAHSFQLFNTVTSPHVTSDYLNQIGTNNNFLQLRFIHDNSIVPDPTENEVCNITMLLDPRGKVHAFTGLLPVTKVAVPHEFVKTAFQRMCYMFRSGPFLSSPDAVRIPRPIASKGTWTWFDEVLKTVPVSQTDQNVRISTTAPLIKEGWLKFTPNPPKNDHED